MSARNQAIKSVVVLGGGTAGWIAAHVLRKSLGKNLKITLIESKKNPIIGVGEATVPTIRLTMRHLGLSEEEWMPKVQGSFKLAVRFNDWLRKGHVYYHPFNHHRSFSHLNHGLYHLPDLPSTIDILQIFSAIPVKDRPSDFARFCSAIPAICDERKSPRNFDKTSRAENYAYHFDTHLLNKYFKELAEQRDIGYLEDTFVSANLKENGFIESLNLETGKKISGDLFLDCTGQQSLLISGALKEPFIDQSQHLFEDTALAAQLPYLNREEEIEPYTTAQAMDAGWVWKIPLQHRIGTGYVFSSQFISPDQAWEEFQKLYPSRMKNISPRLIKFRTGRYRNTWVKNCVALGLAGAFIEPLESTSIGLAEYQIHSLVHLFPDLNFDSHLQDRFNEKVNYCYDQIRDYIILHYNLSQRRDTEFWKAATDKNKASESVNEFLRNLKTYLVYPKPDLDWTIFQRFSIGCILSGMESLPWVNLPILAKVDPECLRTEIKSIRDEEKILLSSLPSLHEYLLKMRPAEPC